MLEELRYLDRKSGLPVPTVLPATQCAISRTLQLLIASRELPVVADAVDRSRIDGGGYDKNANSFIRAVAQTTTGSRRANRARRRRTAGLIRRRRSGSVR